MLSHQEAQAINRYVKHRRYSVTRLLSRHFCVLAFFFLITQATAYFSDGEIRFSTTDLHAANYHLVGTDLRHIAELNNKLAQAEVNFNSPTMFLAECVLVYVDASATSSLLKWLASKFPNSLFVSYEQVNMKDKFGQVMLSNLRSRGCLLAGVEDCESLETQQRR